MKYLGKVWRLLRDFIVAPESARHRAKVRLFMLVLYARNIVGLRRIIGEAPVVVNLTTFGDRAQSVFLAIESIGAAKVRPQRFVLWLDDDELLKLLPKTLRRLQRRGLEVSKCLDYGPHKKQYPYASSLDRHFLPLVTADDDVMYGRHWLKQLMDAASSRPGNILCLRSRNMVVAEDYVVAPYTTWPLNTSDTPALGNVFTGVAGVLYPPEFLNVLADAGTEFLRKAPTADDIWVHSRAAAASFKTCQITKTARHPLAVPGTDEGSLTHSNVFANENDRQIALSYDNATIRKIAAESSTCGPRKQL